MALPGDPAPAGDPARQRLTQYAGSDSGADHRPAGRDDVQRELRRLTDRLASLSPARLIRPGPDGATPAARVRAAVQDLADLAAVAEGRDRLPVPVLADRALGDQLVVLAQDALISGAQPAGVHGELVRLRRSL